MNLFHYGIDWEGPMTDIDQDYTNVDVEETLNPLSPADYSELQSTISPYSESNCHGIDLYVRTLAFVRRKLH